MADDAPFRGGSYALEEKLKHGTNFWNMPGAPAAATSRVLYLVCKKAGPKVGDRIGGTEMVRQVVVARICHVG